jgi:hypothetical protein
MDMLNSIQQAAQRVLEGKIVGAPMTARHAFY